MVLKRRIAAALVATSILFGASACNRSLSLFPKGASRFGLESVSPQQLAAPAPGDAPVLADGTTSSLQFHRTEEGRYVATVDPKRPLRIMHLTDLHFDFNGFGNNGEDRSFATNEKTRQMLTAAVSRFHPDLLMLTGDLAWTLVNPLGTVGYMKQASAFLNTLCANNHCYWAYVFGNHEGGGYHSLFTNRDVLSSNLLKYRIDRPDGRLLYEYQPKDPSKSKWGMFSIEFVDEKQKPLWELYSLYAGDGMRTSISREERSWLEESYEGARARNQGRAIPGFAFFHIPLMQYLKGWEKYESHGWKNADVNGQKESEPVMDSFEKTGVVATFAGHDHSNNFRTQWPVGDRNIYLYYGRTSGEGAMADDSIAPGCTLLDLDLQNRQWTAWEWDTKRKAPLDLDAETAHK